MNQRLLITGLAICALVLVGCSDDEPEVTAPAADEQPAESGADLPDWMQSFGEVDVERQEVDGVEVFVDEANETIYVEDCDDARALTTEGGEFGPSDGQTGYAFLCPG